MYSFILIAKGLECGSRQIAYNSTDLMKSNEYGK